jgi:CheY-like chemotaxis protein
MAKSILVVEDEKSQREILDLILSMEGYEITTAASGEAALRLYADGRRFDLVIADLKMAGIDGITLLDELRAQDSYCKVIILTAHGSVDSVKEALRRGAFDYLEKPYDRDYLLEVVQTAFKDGEHLIPQKRVFLSHSHHDKPFTRALAQALRKHGIKVWLDEAEINVGESLIDKLRMAIDTVDFVVVIISSASVQSAWVQHEVDIAMNSEIENRKIKVLPVLKDDCDLPGFLKGKLYADFRNSHRRKRAKDMLIRSILGL